MRLIDADKLSEWIAEQFCEDMPKHWDRTAEAILEHINEMPTVDIDTITESHEKIGYDKGTRDGYAQATSEVKHGHWVKSEDADDGYCSVCECDMPMYREDWEWKYSETPYCPNCGAKMDDACGRWHKQGNEYRCSECGDTTIVAYKNCPNCGTKMGEVEDEGDNTQ